MQLKGVAGHVREQAELRSVLAELVTIMRNTGLRRTLAIGQLVLERFFGGSFVLWRDRRRNKNNSVRRLADSPECPLSRSALNQAIGVFAAVQMLPDVQALEHIGAGHISLVLPLPHAEREGWLKRADLEHWSVRRLADEIRRHRRTQGERRGRPPASEVTKAFTRVRRSTRMAELALEALREIQLQREDDDELWEIAQRLSLLERKLSELRSRSRKEWGSVIKVPLAFADSKGA